MKKRSSPSHQVYLAITCGSLLASASPYALGGHRADVRHVENNGTDSGSCGERRDPCRSITQAILNAEDGDLILVGPGRYGDLNGDGQFGGPGEEFGCGTGALCVGKAVRLASTSGAAVTVLDGGGAFGSIVSITANGVIFGAPSNGFLLTHSSNTGLAIQSQDVWVMGNVSAGNPGSGFAAGAARAHFVGNFALSNGLGFTIFGNDHRVISNVAQSNGAGYWLRGARHRLVGNVAIGNTNGLLVEGNDHLTVRNSVIGNQAIGFNILQGTTNLRITASNIYGNGTQVQQPVNCGVVNAAGGLVIATNNFWGAPSGPGADPADLACDFGVSTTKTVPFAVKEFKIDPKNDFH